MSGQPKRRGQGGELGAAPTSVWESAPDAPPLSRKAELAVRRPKLPEVVVEVDKNLVIGRSAALCDLVIDDESVSRRHAELLRDPKGYFRLQDLGSVNGIQFEGRMVRRLNLVHGDVFSIGGTELKFSAEMPRLAPPPDEPPVDPMMEDAQIKVPEPPEPSDGMEGIEQLSWGKEK